ncbi:SHOCT domain-containing protein [Nocardia sp. NBC_01329]|uniref:SHOCT domain-containing protein n=1 Tax=Nocardia sp. NBC_01329 TaxID=2903594 RepID=UPI002E14BD20|nr:SHOCT domain-containing protein [Nocardia sp. NBC_01329]
MVFRAGRVGRPGLLGTVARTAVVAGTARATTNALDRRSQRRASEQQAYQEPQQVYQEPPAQYAPPQAPPVPAQSEQDLVAKLERLGRLRDSGTLSEQEFAAAKAQLLQ